MNSKLTITEHSMSTENTGSTEAQISFLTDRVIKLSLHLNTYRKDYSSQRGLKRLLGTRKRLLMFLLREDVVRYTKLLNLLEIRAINK